MSVKIHKNKKMQTSISKLRITNRLTALLDADPLGKADPFKVPETPHPASKTPRKVAKSHFSFAHPEQCPSPQLASIVSSTASLIGLDIKNQSAAERKELVDVLAGNACVPMSHPWALCYGGHQFGSWAGQLGDGRAISMFETQYNNAFYDLQLKGAGMTPYSRFADGYAVLRSSIREYLAAEAMHALGVPTSRSLALVLTPRLVQREVLETGGIVARVATCWLRFGSFELPYSRDEFATLKKLADFTIEMYFTNIEPGNYIAWMQDVSDKTADMIASWQTVGFAHGVMNTDNMSILGKTIDYGPFQFLDIYDTEYICNHSDTEGRYKFSNQPNMGFWNISRLLSAIQPLIQSDEESATASMIKILKSFGPRVSKTYASLLCKKFGFQKPDAGTQEAVIQPFLNFMEINKMDYTLTMRSLSAFEITESLSDESFGILKSYSHQPTPDFITNLNLWWTIYRKHSIPSRDRVMLMNQSNPKFILRNHVVQRVIEESERGNYSGIDEYLKILQSPFDEWTSDVTERFGKTVPKEAMDIRCSCSS